MNAIEYFKEYGLEESKNHLAWMDRVGARLDIHGGFMDDLKQIIDAFELVKSYGGVLRAKSYLDRNKNTGSEINLILGAAINLVEQCY